MKCKIYRGDNPFFVWQNNTADLVKRKGGWKKLFNVKTEREAMRRAKKIATTLMEIIAEELIFGDHSFLFPVENGAILKIEETTNYSHSGYRYCMQTDGKYYKPVLRWAKPRYRHRYNVRFNYPWRRRLFDVKTITYNVKRPQVHIHS